MSDRARAPGKPEIAWTADQRLAIEDRGRDLVVTAAAGSGKTAVLTERVLGLIAPGGSADPCPLESLLVITFTRKAAREMRERIEERIVTGLRADPKSPELRAALDALPRSAIMTIDAFCDRLVRRHFQRAGVSPGAGVADADTERDLERRATGRLFERLARGEGDAAEPFGRAIDATQAMQGEGVIGSLAHRVHHLRGFLASLENPERWRARARAQWEAALEARDYAELAESPRAAESFVRSMREIADELDALLGAAQDIGLDPAGGEAWGEDVRALRDLIPTGDPPEFPALHGAVRAALDGGLGVRLAKLHQKRNGHGAAVPDRAFREHAMERFSGQFERWRGQWFSLAPEHWLDAARLAARQGLDLLDLAAAVEAEVQGAKRRRGVLGFADIARAALGILTDAESKPSDIAYACQRAFRHVLVDEYQDISPIQDALIRRLARSGDPHPGERNLFIVGDLKQSIYRFRRAEPAIFRDRLDACDGDPQGSLRVDLKTNFRSRPGILAAVNALFERLMDREIGGLDYDERARLNPERADADAEDADPVCVEVAAIDSAPTAPGGEHGDDGEDDDGGVPLAAIEREARWIAGRIRALTSPADGLWIPDKAAPEGRRRARSGDCAILVRAIRADLEVWTSTLARCGLAVRAAGRNPLLDVPEMADVLGALRLADHPLQDVALATVMRSPMFGFTEDDLLSIRMAQRRGPFHEALGRSAGRGEADPETPLGEALAARARDFLGAVDRWRETAAREGGEAALEAILGATRFEAHLIGLAGGAGRLHALDDLRGRLRAHAERHGGRATLGDFLRAIEEAGAAADGEDERGEPGPDAEAVHLMTVHKSKGLEFPIVFAARLGSRFEKAPPPDAVFHPESGAALTAIDPARRLKLATPGLTALRAGERRESRAEELRLLYVAMTRARERLILVGSANTEKILDRWRYAGAGRGDRATPFARLTATSPLDLIGPILHRLHRERAPRWLEIATHEAPPPAGERREMPKIQEAIRHAEKPGAWDRARADYIERFGGDERAATAIERLEDRALGDGEAAILVPAAAPDPGLARPRAKVFASSLAVDAGGRLRFEDAQTEAKEWSAGTDADLARAANPESDDLTPEFMRRPSEAAADGRARGELVHRFMQHLDLTGDLSESGLRNQAERLRGANLLDAADSGAIEAIPFHHIQRFFQEWPGLEMVARPRAVSRELPVTCLIPASEFAGESAPGDVIVQGMIDAVIDQGDSAILIDYKTDRVRSDEDVRRSIEKYRGQMAAYKRALGRAWRDRAKDRPGAKNVFLVVECYLVFLSAGRIELIDD